MNEIKELPKGWAIGTLEDFLDYIQPTNYIVESTEYNDRYKTPVLTAGKSFIKGYTNEVNGIFNNLPVIIFDDFTTSNKFVNFPFKVKSSAMKILRQKNSQLDIKYAFYYMQTIKVSTDTHKRYWISVYSKLEIPFPPFNAQLAIVSKIEELLSDLENGRQQLQTARQQLKTYRQSILNSIVTGKNCNSIDAVIEKLDQGWSPRCLNEHSKDDNEWAVIKTSAVQAGKFISIENKILPIDLKPRVQHELKTGDILITRAGPRVRVGICCMIKKTRPRLINCDKVYRIKVNTKIISAEYFELILNTPFYQRKIEKMKTGISDSGLNLTQAKFLKMEIPIPSKDEQQRIVNELESKLTICDNIEATISQSLQQAETLRQSILKQAFEGKLVEAITEQREAEVIPLYKPSNINFYRMQLLGFIIALSKQKKISHGEMTLAKYAYLLDKIYGIPSSYNYERWHLGPFSPEMKLTINNTQYFKKSSGEIDVVNEKTLFKSANPYQQQIENAVNELSGIFLSYRGKERSHKTELLATVCKVIEDIQTTDLQAVRMSMVDWEIELLGERYRTKAEKFSEAETEKCLKFVVDKGWDKKLLKNL